MGFCNFLAYLFFVVLLLVPIALMMECVRLFPLFSNTGIVSLPIFELLMLVLLRSFGPLVAVVVAAVIVRPFAS